MWRSALCQDASCGAHFAAQAHKLPRSSILGLPQHFKMQPEAASGH